mmetsp:Transcript_7894/g.19217  ORF Transcript_7894/g.19217 Transcript_7894/m.19217 type:complete len:323 (+) Transcript_7894:132-1100(+)
MAPRTSLSLSLCLGRQLTAASPDGSQQAHCKAHGRPSFKLTALPLSGSQQALDLGEEVSLLEAVGRVDAPLLEDRLELLDAQGRGVVGDGRRRRRGEAPVEEGLEVRHLLGGRLVGHPGVGLEVDVDTHLLHGLGRDLPEEEGDDHVVCPVAVQHGHLSGDKRGAHHRRDLGTHHEPPAEQEASPQRLLVRHRRQARDRSPLAKPPHHYARGGDPGGNLFGYDLVHVLNRLRRALLVVGGVGGEALDVGPGGARRTHVYRDGACGSGGKDELAVREGHLGGDGRPAGALVAQAVQEDHRSAVCAGGRNDDGRGHCHGAAPQR